MSDRMSDTRESLAAPPPKKVKEKPISGKRLWRWRLFELFLWLCLSVLTAVILTLLSDELLPANF